MKTFLQNLRASIVLRNHLAPWGVLTLLGVTACSPSEYAFTKKPFEPQTDCPKIACPLPYETGCRWKNPARDENLCQTSCGTLSCDGPNAPELESLEQVLDANDLKWNVQKAPGKFTYKVIREVTNSDAVVVSEETAPDHRDTNLTFGKEHFYSVVAVTEFGESAPSAKKSIIPIGAFSIQKGSVESGAVTVQWKPAVGATSYRVLVGNTDSNLREVSASFSTSLNKVQARVSGLPNGEPVFIQVIARNAKATRPSDNVISLIPYDGFQLIGRSAGDRTAKLSWSRLAGASKYRLDYWAESSPTLIQSVTVNSVFEKSVSGLENGKIYVFRVCGFLGAECIPATNTLKAQPIAAPMISSVGGYLKRVEVNWAGVSGATQYQVRVTQNGTAIANSALLSSATLKQSIPLEKVGDEFQFRVYAANANGGESISVAKDGVPLGAFQLLKLTPKLGALDAEWSKSLGATAYSIVLSVNGGAEKILDPISALSRSLTGLENGENVKVYVRATRAGQDGFVDSDSLSSTPRGNFKLLTAADGLHSVSLSWEALSGSQSYEVKMRKAGDVGAPFSSGGTFSGTSAVVSGLAREVKLEFKVEAKLKDGSLVPSQNSLQAIPFGDFSIESAVADVQAVDLAWEEYFPGSKYEVYAWKSEANENTKVKMPLADPTSKQIRIEGLAENQKMKFRVLALFGTHTIAASPDVELQVKANPIKRFKPALAVRGLQCMVCHAKITSNLVTDFGIGGKNFVPRGRTSAPFDQDLEGRRFFTNFQRESAYSNQRSAFQNANVIQGTVIVPKTVISNADLRFLLDENSANQYPDGITLKDLMENETGLGAQDGAPVSMLDRVVPAPGEKKIEEKSKVEISYPTRDEVLGLIPSEKRKSGAIVPINSEYSKASSIKGLSATGSVVSHTPSTVVECHGDVVIQGTLVLQNPTIVTDKKGCRLYVTDSVFIQGAIPLKSTDGGKPTIQITSSRSVLMGLSHYGMSGHSPDPNQPTNPNRPDGAPGLGQGSWTRFGSRLDFEYNPSESSINGVPGTEFFLGLIDEARIVESVAKIPLIDAGDSNVVNAGSNYPGTTVVSGNHLKANFEGLFLNAPHVHSRYFGDFKGVIIAEVAFMARNSDSNTVNEEFHYDPVFDEVPLLLPLLPREPLSIKD
jgi:hypothetical protein